MVGPQELLTSASRVCRRWQRLALSPQLWGRVCVRYEEVTDRPWTPETHPPKDAEEALWVHIVDRKRVGELQAILERAPCLRHLQLSVKENLPEAVESALVAARRVPVESLALLQVPFKHTHELLQSNAASLRVLEWRQPKNLEKWDYFVKELDPLEEEDEATAARRHQLEHAEMTRDSYGRRMYNMARGGRAAWRLIATGMPRLEQLAVDWTWKEETDDLFSTDGRRLAVPRWLTDSGKKVASDVVLPSKLTMFRLRAPSQERGVHWQRLWAWPLLAGSASTLRDVAVHLEPCEPQPLLLCRGLRRLRVPLLKGIDRLAANNLHLTSVTLLGDEDGLPYNDLKWDRSYLYENDDEDPNVDPDPATCDTRTSVRFVRTCADLGLELTFLSLEGFKKSSLEEVSDEVGRLTGLTELRVVRSDVRYNAWGALVSAVGKLTKLRRLVVGYASAVPRGMLTRLGAALAPTATLLRLDGFQDCGRLEKEVRGVVAGRLGMHVAVTQPNVKGCRWEQRCELIHNALCDARVLANHGAAPVAPASWSDQRRRKAALLQCELCAQALRFSRSRLEEVAVGERVPLAGDEEMDDFNDSNDGELSDDWCCEDHSEGSW